MMGQVYSCKSTTKHIREEHVPPALVFRCRCNLAKPSNRWRTYGRQAMGHDTGWKVYIDVDKIIVRVEDKCGQLAMVSRLPGILFF